jgi:putative ABC transport system permease protein
MSTITIFENTRQDVKYGFRSLRKNLGFSAAVVLTVALGIGANTAMFSVIRTVLLKPLAYREPDRVVLIAEGATPVRTEELAAASRSYTELGIYASDVEDMALSGNGDPEVLKVARVSANFLHILGVTPLQGRSILAEEDKPGAEPVALISAGMWQRRFGGDRTVVGRVITLAGRAHTVIGVLPAGFQFPIAGADAWVTRPSEWSAISPESRALSPILSVFGRLKPGVSFQQADAELRLLNRQYATAHPTMLDAKPDEPAAVQSLREAVVSDIRPKLWMLFGAVGFVLLIVCANVASLLLARSTARAREFAVRAAIGAGKLRLISQLLVESLLLAILGGGLGIALAAFAVSAIRGLTFVDLPRAGEIRIDALVLAFGGALALLTGVVFGLAPALSASRPDLARVLRASGEGAGAAVSKLGRRFNPRGMLVVGQVALSIVLLIGATLLIESLARVYRVDPGFQPARLLTAKISLSPTQYDTDEKKAEFYQQLIERTKSLPGVRGAAVAITLPMTETWMGSPVQPAKAPPAPLNQRPISIIQDISPAYFRTLGIAAKRGREFTDHDNAKSAPVVIVSENLVRLFWPQYPSGPDPVGEYILIGNDPHPAQIVGIVANVRGDGRDDDPKAEVYLPYSQKPSQTAMLAVRTDGDPLAFANSLRSQVLAIDRDQPISAISTMEELTEDSEGQLRLMMKLLGGFAAVATVLAVLGLYGVISYSVAQRTKEIGIRRALGARQGNILSLLLKQALVLSVAGAVIGAGASLLVTRMLQDLLFQISPWDPITFAGVSALFVLVGLAASLAPARRAAAIEPLVAIRSE